VATPSHVTAEQHQFWGQQRSGQHALSSQPFQLCKILIFLKRVIICSRFFCCSFAQAECMSRCRQQPQGSAGTLRWRLHATRVVSRASKLKHCRPHL
jgi:hypothetical protein